MTIEPRIRRLHMIRRLLAVRTFCTVSRRPAGPHAPPTRRARLRSRWRSRYGGANPGRLARKSVEAGPLDIREVSSVRVGRPCSRCRDCPGPDRTPSRPSVTAGQPHPSSCLANVHAKTALTEPVRTRRRQLSGAGIRVARSGLTLTRQGPSRSGHARVAATLKTLRAMAGIE